jgi:hypothetical protein
MTRLRINNAPFFVTMLSACLGLMAAGASSQAHQTASSVLSEIAAVTSASHSYIHSSNQALKLAVAFNSNPLPDAFQSNREPSVALYENRKALTASHQLLVVTHLARASLDALPA